VKLAYRLNAKCYSYRTKQKFVADSNNEQLNFNNFCQFQTKNTTTCSIQSELNNGELKDSSKLTDVIIYTTENGRIRSLEYIGKQIQQENK